MFRSALITMAMVSMVCYLGCKDTAGDPVSATPPADETPLTKDDSVAANCQITFDALVAYTVINSGAVPPSIYTELPDGRTVVDFLPDGQLLVNPYNGLRAVPIHARGAIPGDTGWVTDGTRFWVNGVGETAALDIVMLEYDPG
jgi:hypothetical protein